MASTVFWLIIIGTGSTWGGHVPETAGNKSLSLAILAPALYMQRALASFSVALEEVERRQLLPGYTIDWKLWDTNCNPFQGKAVAIKICFTVKCISERRRGRVVLFHFDASTAFNRR